MVNRAYDNSWFEFIMLPPDVYGFDSLKAIHQLHAIAPAKVFGSEGPSR
jgi:hypothetical protein